MAGEDILGNASLQSAHIGISVYDPASSQYLYNYQGDKYFVPASNTKLFSLYAGMKYLGDSLTGIRYIETDTAVFILPTGDPTLLHPDFSRQPVIDFFKRTKKNIYITDTNWQEQALGAGWSWDDYNDDYMVERSRIACLRKYYQMGTGKTKRTTTGYQFRSLTGGIFRSRSKLESKVYHWPGTEIFFCKKKKGRKYF